MKAIMVMFDSLNRRYLSPYGCREVQTPNFERLAEHSVRFDQCFIGSMPCMPARRELHTGRYNFMHRSWGPLEPFDDSMPELLKRNGVYTHLVSDHQHYWEDGGATYHGRYNSWEISRGQEGDLWKGRVKDPNLSQYLQADQGPGALKAQMKKVGVQNLKRQDAINREYLKNEEDMPQAVTFRNGLEFIEENHDEDHWFLQIETFDPHEPFFASKRFRELYPDPDYSGPEFDWPPYAKVSQSKEQAEHCRKRYRALVSMCDYYLGKVLDAMDQYDLWKDTLLIVNTDHGFLLGEHDWWAKSSMPYYNEIAHIPLFIWDPRCKKSGEVRQALVQMIDLAPTLLTYFEIEPTPDMLGKSLEHTIREDQPVREYALFGCHGSHINITDGRYVYMRCPKIGSVRYEYTLMPTRMRDRFRVEELGDIQLAEPFSFTKGCRVMRLPEQRNPFADPVRYGDLLFDLKSDSGQEHPLEDLRTQRRLLNEIRHLMEENDAPEELYEIFGVCKGEEVTEEKLLGEKRLRDLRRVKGAEELKWDDISYLQISVLQGALPPELFCTMLDALKANVKKKTQKKLASEDVLEAFDTLPLPEFQKAMLGMILKGYIQNR